jgi:hypothetical protein
MKSSLLFASALGLAGAAAIGWAALPAASARDAGPVVVELFQSQGCSSCPPAQANINAIADRPDVLALSFGVTYWDQLGWKDSFASAAFTDRQWDYARRNGRTNVATPQVWVNGRTTIVGSNRAQLDAAIAGAGRAKGSVLALQKGRLAIAAGQAPVGGADIWLVRYDPRTIQVAIRAGENNGRTLPHRDVVRELVHLGRWTGQAQSLALPAATQSTLRTAAFLQAGKGGPIVAAAKG